MEELSPAQRQELNDYFDTQVSPALTPLIIHPSQPFPFFSNLSLSLAFLLHDERGGESVDARVKVPAEIPAVGAGLRRSGAGRARVRPAARSHPGECAQALPWHAALVADAVPPDAGCRSGNRRRGRSERARGGARADPPAPVRAGRAAGIRRECRRAPARTAADPLRPRRTRRVRVPVRARLHESVRDRRIERAGAS